MMFSTHPLRWLALGLGLTLWLGASCLIVDGDDDDDDPADAAVQLNNQSSTTIDEFFVRPSSDISWGPNLLGGVTVAPGQTFEVFDIPSERRYDFLARGFGSYEVMREGEFLDEGEFFTWTVR